MTLTAETLTAESGFRWSALVRAPRAVWALTLLWTGILATWAVVTPMYDAPDEPNHVDRVLATGLDLHWPEYDEVRLSRRVARSMEVAGFADYAQAPFVRSSQPVRARDAMPRDQRPGFADLGPEAPLRSAINQLAQHPPLHYKLLRAALLPTPPLLAHDRVVGLLRLVDVLLVAPLPLLAHALARRLFGAGRPALAAAALPLLVPQLAHIGGAVNNDDLLILLGGILAVLLGFVSTGDTSLRTSAWVGLVLAAALLTKGFALGLPVAVAAAYVVAAARDRQLRRPAAMLGVALLVALPGAAWWIRNLVLHGRVQPSLVAVPDTPTGFVPDAAFFWPTFGTDLSDRFWGAFGWNEIALVPSVTRPAAVVALVAILLGVGFRRRREPWWRADLLVALVPTLAIGGIVAWGAWDWYSQTSGRSGIQGRYLFPGVVGMAVVAAIGLHRLVGRGLPLLLVLAAGAMQGASLLAVVRHWYAGADVHAAVRSLLAWQPWPTSAVQIGAAAVAAAALWTLVEVLLSERPPTPWSTAFPGAESRRGRRPAVTPARLVDAA